MSIDKTQDMIQQILESYKNIPRENKNPEEIKTTEEENAAREIMTLLKVLIKKIRGEFGEQDERILEDNAEEWKKNIEVLRNYIIQETEKR